MLRYSDIQIFIFHQLWKLWHLSISTQRRKRFFEYISNRKSFDNEEHFFWIYLSNRKLFDNEETFFEYISNRKSFDHEEYFFWLYLES